MYSVLFILTSSTTAIKQEELLRIELDEEYYRIQNIAD